MLVGIGGESSWRSAWDLVGNAEPAMRDERALSVCAHGHSAEVGQDGRANDMDGLLCF